MNTRQIDLIAKDCAAVFSDGSNLAALKNEVILITGGTGFIGSWLLESINYLNSNYNFNTKLYILAPNVDNYKSEYPHLFSSNLVEEIKSDVRQISELPNDVTYIIHAAGNPDNRMHLSDPLKITDTIVSGTKRVLEVGSLLPNLKRFLNLSSGLVYGRHSDGSKLIDENHLCSLSCSTITSAYPEAKRMAETITHIFRSQYRIPVVNLRPFAFIGPYQKLDRPWAINNFIRDALNGGPIKILGNENSVRSYMYPSDLAVWILTSLIKGDDGMTLNLGSAEGYSLRQIAEIVTENFTNQISISTSANHQDQTATHFVPSIERAKEMGLEINVDTKEAIRKTIEWFQLN